MISDSYAKSLESVLKTHGSASLKLLKRDSDDREELLRAAALVAYFQCPWLMNEVNWGVVGPCVESRSSENKNGHDQCA
ncbi:MAG: hypothetical protein Ct9H90mP16_13370 [Candidatus Poseidoniales archaeon]|nr:MAG: hypothetical protein Ct9H90mP16_13370 [Candidatus Poseidoniales archaeon]